MNKNKYITLIIIALIFIIPITIILLSNKNKVNWIEEVKNSDSYQITLNNCNGKEVTVPNEVIDEISNKLNNISDNGPWTGDNNTCYSNLTISYTKDNRVDYITIKIIDDNSIVLSTITNDRYYVNTKELNNYINNLLIEY